MDPITQGKDWNFFSKVAISGAAFPTPSQVTINIKNQVSFSLVNEGSSVVEYSFNGTTLHGDLTPSSPTQAIFFDNRRITGIWFRVVGGGPGTVRVEAWSAGL